MLDGLDVWLTDMLHDGPRSSGELKELASKRGYSAKALRISRERLGVSIKRSGNGRNMRSTWRLPLAGETPTSSTGAIARNAANAEARTTVRIAAFVQRGVDPVTAESIAAQLVILRDQDEASARAVVSCAMCQSWARSQCPIARPVQEIHECWYSRVEVW